MRSIAPQSRLPQPRPEVLNMRPVVHGGTKVAELDCVGLHPDEVLDFSANVNPFGPAPGIRDAVTLAAIDRYPDPEATQLRRALAGHLQVSPGQILAGNGASELIWLVALAFVRPRDHVLIVGPTYGEYARAAALMEGHLIEVATDANHGFIMPTEIITRSLDEYQPRLTFVCNPNNPTGVGIPLSTMTSWCKRCPKTVFVIDEAYLGFTSEVETALSLRAKNVVVLRSMTKDFALPGLRLGYAVADEEMIAWLERVRPPWSVNAVAQAAGVAALDNAAHCRDTLRVLEHAKADLIAGISALGFETFPSVAPFFLVRVGDAARLRVRLLKHRVLVRDCASFGLPEFIRIAPRRPEENERLLSALKEEASHAR